MRAVWFMCCFYMHCNLSDDVLMVVSGSVQCLQREMSSAYNGDQSDLKADTVSDVKTLSLA